MCGGHGIHRLISRATAGISASERSDSVTSQASNSYADIENEVKLMYARGEIGAQAFHRLRAMAQARELRMQDLQAFQIRRVDSPIDRVAPTARVDETTLAFRHQLQEQREYLEAACAETEAAIQRLQLEAAVLYQEAEATALTPQMRSEALSRAESVEERIDLIRERLSYFKASLAEIVTQQRFPESQADYGQ